jgi:hypothetical protein
MAHVVAQVMRSGCWRRRISIAALSALLACFAALSSPAPSAAACPEGVDLCGTTNKQGTYFLQIPPFSFLSKIPGYEWLAPLEDCVWEVEVEFGDGSPNETYTFDAAIGLSGSHTFPEPGTYIVQVYAREGVHADSGEPCPDFDQTAAITFPEPPPPPPEPPAPEPPGGDPESPAEPSGTGDEPGSGLPPPASGPRSSWRRCAGEVLTRGVGCRKAKRVIRRATKAVERLPAAFGGWLPARAAGFRCRLRHTPTAELACRRGARRILAPING